MVIVRPSIRLRAAAYAASPGREKRSTGYTAEQYQTYAREHPEWAFLAGIPEIRNATWIDLPTSHWPMWSRPNDLAMMIGDVANAAA